VAFGGDEEVTRSGLVNPLWVTTASYKLMIVVRGRQVECNMVPRVTIPQIPHSDIKMNTESIVNEFRNGAAFKA
jgi:hypothetical protein